VELIWHGRSAALGGSGHDTEISLDAWADSVNHVTAVAHEVLLQRYQG